MLKQKIDWLLPKFVRLPLFLAVAINFAVYYIPSRLLVTDVERYDLTMALDTMLPCVPFFLLIYVLAYVQWIEGYVFHCRDSVKLCYHLVTADLISKAICLACFIFIPTTITRPEITGNGLFEWGTRFIYAVDDPVNLFPSIHCLESWMCFRGAMILKKKNGWYIAAHGVFAVLVFASTVLIKQHFVIDIVAGIIVGEIGLFLSKQFKLWRIFNKIQTPSAKAWVAEHGM